MLVEVFTETPAPLRRVFFFFEEKERERGEKMVSFFFSLSPRFLSLFHCLSLSLARSLSSSSLFSPLSLSSLFFLSPEAEAHDPPVGEVVHPFALEDRGGLVVPVDQHRRRDADVERQEIGRQRRDAQRREVLVVHYVGAAVVVDVQVEVVGVGAAVDRRVGRRDLEGAARRRGDRVVVNAVLRGARLDSRGAVVSPE